MLCSIALVWLFAGCGDADDGSAGQAPPALYTGATDQGLPVSVQTGERGAVIALTWVARCAGDEPGAIRGLHNETFLVGELPGRVADRRREDGNDGDGSTFLRELDARADGAGVSGRFRIRTRGYDGQLPGVNSLCDSGAVGFSATTAVSVPQVPAVTATKADYREATFQEEIIRALSSLNVNIERSDARGFCGLLTVRLRRTFCNGRTATTLDRMAQLSFITDAGPARHLGRQAVVVFDLGDHTEINGVATRSVRTLKFVRPPARTWLLDRIGPVREVPD